MALPRCHEGEFKLKDLLSAKQHPSPVSAQSQKQMRYVTLGSSGLRVSALIMGTMQYGSAEWQPWIMGEEDALIHIKAAYDAGIQTFDTADVYSNGQSEIVLGNVIKKLGLPRDEIVVMTKISRVVAREPGHWFVHSNRNPEDYGYVNQGGLSRKHIFAAVKKSLERLQLDYVDVLQCHRADPITPISETMHALHDIIKEGYARYIGMGSCWAWQFHAMQNYAIANGLTPFISMQNQYSLLYRADEMELYPTLKLFGTASIPWSPLARGLLARPFGEESRRGQSDKLVHIYKSGPTEDKEVIKRVQELAQKKGLSMARVALAWTLRKPGVTAPIVGPTSVEQLHDLLGAMEVDLSDDEMTYLEECYRPRILLDHE
ncbi:Aldo/keto reductase [Gloeophyllum trabeum ATCC 11539]|uniref:Aldo/keto reductase n=1 Tax=Gloeophyllum trabeum (strain ATCC 11539 / FP-39264 / Madison 617) TaxID=670483 RepID=S7PU03_GLOTA|nr:Aldo/keto reductase [Gloeophyllum trabeum ATCC 11539]EPQ51291.1 Aldo/keto reductase [Gloeophyllum trabeum ATCC 11539]